MTSATTSEPQPSLLDFDPTQPRPSRFRWVVCGLLFFATTINYMDRQIIGVLKPELVHHLGWTETDYGNIVFSFQMAYAIGYLVAGGVIDRIGVRWGLGLAVVLWSGFAMTHALSRTVWHFCFARFGLGLAEGGNFPASVKAISEWFPQKERALATGLFNAGSSIGPIVTPLLVPWITVHWGWKTAFVVVGALGLIWFIGWYFVYQRPERHPMVNAEELSYIRSDPIVTYAKLPWLSLFAYRATWAAALGTFLTSPIWWFWLFWIPGYLNTKYGLNILQLGPPLVAIYLMTDFGSIGGGYLSSKLIKRGWTVNAARKTAMLVCALCVVPVVFTPAVGLWPAVFLVGLAASAHQGFSANLFTFVSDTMPKGAVSSVVGIGGFVGGIGGMCIAKLAGFILDKTDKDYRLLFLIASSSYLLAILVMHLLVPRIKPYEPPPARPTGFEVAMKQ